MPEENQNNFYMSQMDGKWTLKRDHAQIITIRHKCKSMSANSPVQGDFVVGMESVIVVTDDSAVFETIMKEVHHFFVYSMLPCRDCWQVVNEETSRRLQGHCTPL